MTSPLGPMDSSQEFVMILEDQSTPTLIRYNDGTLIFQEAFTSSPVRYSPLINENNILTFQAQGTYNLVKIVSTRGVTKGMVLVGSYVNGTMLLTLVPDGSRSPSLNGVQLQSQYQEPPDTEVVLSSAPYTIIANDNETTGSWLPVTFQITFDGRIIPATQRVVFIPLDIYYNAGGCMNIKMDPPFHAPLLMRWCSYEQNKSTAPWNCHGLPPGKTWTTLQQCDGNIPYIYCSNSQYCGDGNCYGACVDGRNCVYDSKGAPNSLMICSGSGGGGGGGGGGTVPLVPLDPANKPLPWTPTVITPWYKQTWFIILIAVVVFLIVFAFIIYERWSKQKEHSHYDYYHSSYY